MAKPKPCAECGLAVERRGLHPQCRAARDERRKAERFAAVMSKVRPAVLRSVNACSMTVSPRLVHGMLSWAWDDKDFRLANVKRALDVLTDHGEIHRIGKRFFSPNLLRESRSAVR